MIQLNRLIFRFFIHKKRTSKKMVVITTTNLH